MKLWFKFFLGATLALIAATAHGQGILTPVSITANPASALPGASVTYTITVDNSDPVQFGPGGATADFTVTLTNLVTNSTFTFTQAGVVPTSGYIGKATVDPATGQDTPGVGTFTITKSIPPQFTEAGAYGATVLMTAVTGGNGTGGAPSSFTQSSAVLTVTGKPDLEITSLTYPSGTSYVGGTQIPMTITYRNNQSTNGTQNVPFTPGVNGFPAFVRIQVVLSSNPTFGDADDFQLTINDINQSNFGSNFTTDNSPASNAAVMADGSLHTFSWTQILPGNFSGSYYVLAKIDTLNALPQNDPPALTVNGNNVWGGNTLNPAGTLINLIPSNFPTIYLGSHASGVATSANGYSDNPSMTADGRYVTFASDATNLVSSDTNGARDIFIFDSQTNTVRRLSLSQQGAQGNGASNNPVISSANGRYVAFESLANNLDTLHGDTNGFSDIFVVDSVTGLITRISGINAAGGQANNPSFKPAISQTGRYIAFQSTATNLLPGVVRGITVTNGGSGYATAPTVTISGGGATTNATAVADISAGVVTSITLTSGGIGYNGTAVTVSFSGGGGSGAVATASVIPAVTVTPGASHIYVYDRDVSGSGVFDTAGNTTIGIVDVDSTTPSTAVGNANSIQPTLSADGSWIAFASKATNLVAGGTTAGRQHVYVRARGNVGTATSGIKLVSVANTTAAEGNGNSQTPSLSADGHYVAFASVATNLVGAADTNGVSDIFVYDNTAAVGTPVVRRMSIPDPSTGFAEGTDPSAAGFELGSINPTISADGRYVAFASLDDNLTAGDAEGQAQATDANQSLDIFVHDRDANNTDPNGTGVPANYDVVATATTMVSLNPFGYQTNGLLGVPSTPASNIYPVISANGRFVAFPSDAESTAGLAFGATNLLPVDNNGLRDVFLYDRRTNATITPPTPPIVTITSPGSTNYVLVNTAIPITATATTSIGVVSSVQFFVNGVSLGTSTTFPYSQTWTPTAVGTYTLSALVTDSFGNIGVSSNVFVTVVAAPSVGVTNPVSGSSFTLPTTQTIRAVAAASNPGATITSVEFFVNNGSLGFGVYNPSTSDYSISWTPAAAGTYALKVIAIDSLGTQTTSPVVSVTINPAGGGGGGIGGGTPPTVAVTSPAQGTIVPINVQQTITATATATDPTATVASVEIFVNGVSLGVVTSAPYTVNWTPAAAGSYSLIAVATDSNGAQGTSAAVTVSTAGAAPTVTFSPALPASIAVNIPLTITSSATAASGYTVTSVDYFVDGVSIGSATQYPYLLQWSGAVSLGSHVITAVATDNVGNKSAAASATIVVGGGTAPAVVLTSPANNSAYFVGSTISLSATASLGSGLITSVSFYVNGIFLSQSPPQTGTSQSPVFAATFVPAASGSYVFTAVAADSSGNQAVSAPVTVTVTAAAVPTVTLQPTPPVIALVNVPMTLTATAQANPGFNIAQVAYFANGVMVGSASAYPYAVVWTPSQLGATTITAVATDNTGASGTSAPATVTVVTGTPPGISLISPVNGSTSPVGSQLTLTATTSLGAGLVSKVEFFANGISIGSSLAPNLGQGSPPFFTIPWVPAAAGTYVFTAIVTDTAGNTTTSSPATVTVVPNTPPTVSLTSPTTGTSYPLGSGVILAASAGDTDGRVTDVSFFANGVLVGSAASSPYLISWTPQAAGTYQITARATDDAGGVATSTARSITITAAGAAATVTLANPALNGTIPVGNDVTLSATATGGNGPITLMQFFVNGSLVGSDNTSPYSVTWTPAAPGNYKLVAVATDSAGVSASSATMTVSVIANAAPTVAVLTPANGATASAGLPVTLTATAADTDGSIVSVRYFVNGNSAGTPATSAPYTAIWTPTAPGSYTIIAEATDNSGNVVDSAGHTIVIVSNSAPTVSVLTPASGATTVAGVPVSLTAVATDADGSVASVRFLVNGNAVGLPATTAPYSTPWTPTAAGIYSIVAEATDDGGNIGTSAVRLVTVVANQPPVVSLLSPSASFSTTAGLPITLIATASDPDGTVAQVRFLVNGVQVGAPLTTAPYTTSWTPTVGGVFGIVAEATDNVGLISTSVAINAYVTQNLLPSVAITSPPNGATVRVNNNTTITAAASDGDGSINGVEFFVNGVSIGATSTYPYRVQWTPKSEGIYRVVAVATDNTGAAATSPTVLLVASANAGNAIATGNYAGTAESGNFAIVAATGSLATFIARSTTLGVARTYLYSNIPVDVSGGFSLTDDANAVLVSGVVGDTGTSGSFDSGRLTFIGIDTRFFPAATTVASGYYTGTLAGDSSSSLVAIVGIDGSIMIYVADGDFNDAANGTVNASGAFSLVSTRGNRFTGTVDPLTGLLTGHLSGANGGDFSGAPATLGGDSGKVSGFGREVGSNIIAQNGNTFDQVLLTGATASITADPGQITRISFVDLNDDIVQVEFSGAGRLALALDNPSGPAAAVNYNQPGVAYMKGHANLVITGANETTNVSVFSVGRITAFNQALFKSNVNYDGVADIGYITILSTNGKFGGVRTADADYIASQGVAGICAPGVQFLGPVFVGDINAADSATPMLLLGAASDVRITGGDLWQANGRALQISGVSQLKFVDGMNSQGVLLQAQSDRSRIEQNGVDVTAQVIVNP